MTFMPTSSGKPELVPVSIETLQVNVTKLAVTKPRCHCHVDASLTRSSEQMNRATIDRCPRFWPPMTPSRIWTLPAVP
jgi:hypothetical protein